MKQRHRIRRKFTRRKPTFQEIVVKVFRKRMSDFTQNITRNNVLFERLCKQSE